MTTPTNALATVVSDALPIARQVFGDDRIQVLKDVVAKGCTDAELEVFALVCQRTKLDPFARPPQIYAIKRYDKNANGGQGGQVLTVQASIDSFRLVAARTREYQGQVGPLWCGADGVWTDLWLSDEHPAAAKVGVRRKGFPEPVWSTAVWSRAAQFVPVFGDSGSRRPTGSKLAPFWEKMGPEMLAKTAETNALKRAFPNDTEGLELAAIAEEARVDRAALAARYTEIQGSDATGTFYDLPAPGPSPELPGRGEALPAEPRRSGARSYEEVFDDEPPVEGAWQTPTADEIAAPRDIDTGEVLETPTAPVQPKIAVWARNRQLVAEAHKRKLTGVPTLPAKSTDAAVETANKELEERIRNYDLDQQLVKEQEQLLA